jgi:catechol 2,3-dioxygenase-like lactoylglutathione lyase family enzyme
MSLTKAPPPVRAIHHAAFRCRDAQETREFYEKLVGLEFAGAMYYDKDPETGERRPYVHIFFKMTGGDFLAFFDTPESATQDSFKQKSPYDVHYAFEVNSMQALEEFKQRFVAAGIDVLGPLDHEFCQSIYLWDPNGFMIEFTVKTAIHDEYLANAAKTSDKTLQDWARESAPVKQKIGIAV